jgi:hypothetical protein
MSQVKNFLGTKLPDGTIRVEGPLSAEDTQNRAKQIWENEKIKPTCTLAASKGEAMLKLAQFINIDQENTKV